MNKSKIELSFLISTLLFCFLHHSSQGQAFKDYPYQPIDFNKVKVHDQFWSPKIKTNAEVSIPHTLQKCESEGRIDNFYRAAHVLQDNKSTTYPFDDSDLYKVIEGAAYSLQAEKNPELEAYIDTLISIIGAAQEDDGYLYTFRTMNISKRHEWLGEKRWEKTEDLSHELYNLGHLFEAAAAHYKATGKRNFLNIALKSADLLVNTFGWGKEEKFPGHQVIETGLVKLYRITEKKEYLDLAKFYLDLRGKEGHFNRKYSQSHIKVVDQHTAVGHAVRATYMYSGMADIAALTGNKDYQIAIDNIWNDVTNKKMYITGGIGSTNNGEAFGEEYDLPNMTAYAETCAAIASVYWNMRMFSLHGDAKYIDILERTLYNGLLSGVSISGDHFFYPNPLASIGQHQRSNWHNCACCVSNMTRFMPSVPGYVYAQKDNELYINLYMGSTVSVSLPKAKVQITQNTNYPWDGTNTITINPEKKSAKFALHLRIPGWAKNNAVPGDLYYYENTNATNYTIVVNGKKVPYVLKNGYAIFDRKWKRGDQIQINLDMSVRKVLSNQNITTNKNKMALERGPLVYCLEGTDNVNNAVLNIVMDKSAEVTPEFRPNMLNGVTVLKSKGTSYKEKVDGKGLDATFQDVVAIPYYSWANRGNTEMQVWVPYDASLVRPLKQPTISSKSTVNSTLANKRMHRAVNDLYYPSAIQKEGNSYLHWWPLKNTVEWITYDFEDMQTVSESSVYWFDDGPWGGCRIPASWKLYYKKGEEWIAVENTIEYPITKDEMNKVSFKPIQTKSMKLEIQLPEEFATGLYEWEVK
jgi:uncharacterized protein